MTPSDRAAVASGRATVVLLACALAAAVLVGSAVAVETTATDVPDESEVGTDVEATIELTDLFTEFESWTLRGETDLVEVTWTVQQYDQAGNQISQTSYDGGSFEESIDIASGVSRVTVRVTGTTPEVAEYRYEPPQRYLLADLTLVRSGGTQREIDTYRVHHYTTESAEARAAIDDAAVVVEDSGDDDAQATLESAISAYEAGNFENAIGLAERAESAAARSQQLRSTLVYGGAAVVLVVLLGGGYYLYRSRQQGPSRLR